MRSPISLKKWKQRRIKPVDDIMRELFEPRTIAWVGNRDWSWGAAIGDCLCPTCKNGSSWHPLFEFNLAKISEYVDSEDGFIKYIDDAWQGFFILTQLRYERVKGYWDGENETKILSHIMKELGATLVKENN
jgi:hypothetical protein